MKSEDGLYYLEYRFNDSPKFGCQTHLSKTFDDKDLFKDENENPTWESAVLKEIELYYGMPPQPKIPPVICDDNIEFPEHQKMILGIELTYAKSENGEEVKAKHSCDLSEATQVEKSNYILAEGEFFCKVEIKRKDRFFSYMKFIQIKIILWKLVIKLKEKICLFQ